MLIFMRKLSPVFLIVQAICSSAFADSDLSAIAEGTTIQFTSQNALGSLRDVDGVSCTVTTPEGVKPSSLSMVIKATQHSTSYGCCVDQPDIFPYTAYCVLGKYDTEVFWAHEKYPNYTYAPWCGDVQHYGVPMKSFHSYHFEASSTQNSAVFPAKLECSTGWAESPGITIAQFEKWVLLNHGTLSTTPSTVFTGQICKDKACKI